MVKRLIVAQTGPAGQKDLQDFAGSAAVSDCHNPAESL
jgi:hypothetical protein